MSDWSVGDLVIAVANDCPECASRGTHDGGSVTGTIYRVDGLGVASCVSGRALIVAGLNNVDEDGDLVGFCRRRFRKIDKPEACEDEFAVLLKRLRSPARVE